MVFNSSKKLIIDTDGGIDDVVALLYASYYTDILALTLVFGNTDIDNVCSNVIHAQNVSQNKNKPKIYKGCHAPIFKNGCSSNIGQKVHGSDGLNDVFERIKNVDDYVEDLHAVNALVKYANKFPGEITLILIGPATNAALAHRLDATFSSKLKQVIFIGCSIFAKGQVFSLGTEFNVLNDAEAASIVFAEFQCPIMVVPYDTCQNCCIPSEDYREVFRRNSSPSMLLAKLFNKENSRYSNAFAKGLPLELCDNLAITAFLFPNLIKSFSEHAIYIETEGRCRGVSLVDWFDDKVNSPKIKIVHDFDNIGYVKTFKAIFK